MKCGNLGPPRLAGLHPMLRSATLLVALWPVIASAETPALCADAPNQAEGTKCAKRKLDAAETDLTRTYDALKAKLDPLGRRNLDLAQQAWRRFRELECNLETGYDPDRLEANGTIQSMLHGECAVAQTERRTRDLTEQAACPGGNLSCER
jgi:uncharacterized protein YecT (DUF1311 family)